MLGKCGLETNGGVVWLELDKLETNGILIRLELDELETNGFVIWLELSDFLPHGFVISLKPPTKSVPIQKGRALRPSPKNLAMSFRLVLYI